MSDRKVTVSLFGDDRDLDTKIRDAKAKLDELRAKAGKVPIGADNKDLLLKVREAEIKLDELNGKVKERRELGLSTAKASLELDKLDLKLDSTNLKLDKLDAKAALTDAEGAGLGFTQLGSSLGSLSNFGLPALIAGLVALSGQAVVAAFGLGGLGLAAFKDIDPILKAAKATGGLSANMGRLDATQKQIAYSLLGLGVQYSKFTNQLKPEVLGSFNQVLNIAGTLLSKTEPIAAAAGKALTGVLGSIDAEFKSGTWQQFFGFMEKNAGPDIKQLGLLFTNLLNVIPPLAEALHPLGSAIINDITDITSLSGGLAKLTLAVENYENVIARHQATSRGSNFLGSFDSPGLQQFSGLSNLFKNFPNIINPAIGPAGKLVQWIEKLGASSDRSSHSQNGLAAAGKAAALAAQSETTQMTALSTAIGNVINKTLTLQGNDVSWQQAMQSATTAINANKNALDGNSASALAAKQAIISSSQAALADAQSQITMNHNTAAASRIINAQIAYLENHAGKSRFAAQEVYALIQAENRIPGHVNSSIVVQSAAAAAAIAGIENRLAALNGQTSTVYVDYSVGGQSYVVPHHRHAAGTQNAPAGWSWVGERGPELVNMKGGEVVLSHGNSMSAVFGGPRGFAEGTSPVPQMRPGALGGGSVQLVISGQGDDLVKAIVKSLRYEVRTNGGGNVQQHLGWGTV